MEGKSTTREEKNKRVCVCRDIASFVHFLLLVSRSLYSALKLAAKEWPRMVVPDIILIDTKDRFLFKPLMYELLTEEAPIDVIAPKFSELIDEEKVGHSDCKLKIIKYHTLDY